MKINRHFYTFWGIEGWWYIESNCPTSAFATWNKFVKMAKDFGVEIKDVLKSFKSLQATKFVDVVGLPLKDMDDSYDYYRGYVNQSEKGNPVEVIVRANCEEEAKEVLTIYAHEKYRTGNRVAVTKMSLCKGVILKGNYEGIMLD